MHTGKQPSVRHQAETLAVGLPPLQAEAERVAASLFQGMHGRRRAGQGESFWDYRPYRPEDTPAMIDWRRSARSDQLYVRQNEWEAAQNVWMWRDGRAGMAWRSTHNGPSKKDRASVLLLALGILLARGGEHIGLLGTRAHMGKAGVQALARSFETDHDSHAITTAVLETTTPPRHAHIVLATDGYDPIEFWEKCLTRLAGRGARGVFLHVTDPGEEDFPFEGRLRFEAIGRRAVDRRAVDRKAVDRKAVDRKAIDQKSSFVLGRAERAREAYRRRFQAHRQALKALTRRLGWSYLAHRSDAATAPALALLQSCFGQTTPGMKSLSLAGVNKDTAPHHTPDRARV